MVDNDRNSNIAADHELAVQTASTGLVLATIKLLAGLLVLAATVTIVGVVFVVLSSCVYYTIRAAIHYCYG